MKRILIIILALLIVSPLAFAEKRAFLVGISKYKTEWRDIHGSEDVALLSRELINQDFQVTIVTNEQATRNGIINGLKAFIKKIKKGDMLRTVTMAASILPMMNSMDTYHKYGP